MGDRGRLAICDLPFAAPLEWSLRSAVSAIGGSDCAHQQQFAGQRQSAADSCRLSHTVAGCALRTEHCAADE